MFFSAQGTKLPDGVEAAIEAGGGSLAKENRNAGNIDFGDGKGYKHKKGKASNGRGK